MDIEKWRVVAYVVTSGVLVAILYGYIVYLYRNEKTGKRDYEKYGKLALDDEIDSPLIEDKPISERYKDEK